MTPAVFYLLIGSALLLIVSLVLMAKERTTRKKLDEFSHNAKLKDDFIHMIIHELRAPLTAIKDSSKLIMDTPAMPDDSKKQLLTIIHEQSQKMLEQVSTLLDAAKFDAGRFTLEKVPSDLKKVITEKLQVFDPQAKTKNIKLISELGPDLPQFVFDPVRIGQVVNNLLSNSLKFTPEGGAITVSLQQKTLKTVEVTVSDTGVGIPKDKQSSLFSEFYEVKTNNGNKPTGTGLGLYITKSIIQAHGGTISLVSEPNKGTSISFTLPM